VVDGGTFSEELRNEMTTSKQTIRTKEYLSRVKAKKVKRREERREKKRSELRGGAEGGWNLPDKSIEHDAKVGLQSSTRRPLHTVSDTK
jgi:hypothetical protein